MFDYNRGYSPDLESSGIADIFRIPKFSYDFYKSQVSPRDFTRDSRLSSPNNIEIASYWSPDSPLDVTVFSNADEVALYLNDSLIGRQTPTVNELSDHLSQAPFVFHINAFEAGTLMAVAFVDGKEVGLDRVSTATNPDGMDMEIDFAGIPIATDHMDVFFARVKILDHESLVSTAQNEVTFEIIKGKNVELIGENPVKAEAGIASILVRTTSFHDEIHIQATSPGLGTMVFILTPEK
jgi:beta-galactosidase